MNLESQVCSLELAKRLKELKVKQDSYFYWEGYYPVDDYKFHHIIHLNMKNKSDDDFPRYSAFTVAELGEMLPFTIEVNEFEGTKFKKPKTMYLNGMLGYTQYGYEPAIQYNYYLYEDNDAQELDPLNMVIGIDFADTNEANARAKMLIYLIENKLCITN